MAVVPIQVRVKNALPVLTTAHQTVQPSANAADSVYFDLSKLTTWVDFDDGPQDTTQLSYSFWTGSTPPKKGEEAPGLPATVHATWSDQHTLLLKADPGAPQGTSYAIQVRISLPDGATSKRTKPQLVYVEVGRISTQPVGGTIVWNDQCDTKAPCTIPVGQSPAPGEFSPTGDALQPVPTPPEDVALDGCTMAKSVTIDAHGIVIDFVDNAPGGTCTLDYQVKDGEVPPQFATAHVSAHFNGVPAAPDSVSTSTYDDHSVTLLVDLGPAALADPPLTSVKIVRRSGVAIASQSCSSQGSFSYKCTVEVGKGTYTPLEVVAVATNSVRDSLPSPPLTTNAYGPPAIDVGPATPVYFDCSTTPNCTTTSVGWVKLTVTPKEKTGADSVTIAGSGLVFQDNPSGKWTLNGKSTTIVVGAGPGLNQINLTANSADAVGPPAGATPDGTQDATDRVVHREPTFYAKPSYVGDPPPPDVSGTGDFSTISAAVHAPTIPPNGANGAPGSNPLSVTTHYLFTDTATDPSATCDVLTSDAAGQHSAVKPGWGLDISTPVVSSPLIRNGKSYYLTICTSYGSGYGVAKVTKQVFIAVTPTAPYAPGVHYTLGVPKYENPPGRG